MSKMYYFHHMLRMQMEKSLIKFSIYNVYEFLYFFIISLNIIFVSLDCKSK